MTPTSGQRAIEKFLGYEATIGGPFGLLGVDPGACTPSAVEAALERQLDRVSQHPESETPEADGVRLALDTAAAELLDPVMRARWIDEYRRAQDKVWDQSQRITAPGSVGAETSAAATAAQGRRDEDSAVDDEAKAGGRMASIGDPIIMRMLVWTAIGLGIMLLSLVLGAWLIPSGPPQAKAPAPAPAPGPVQAVDATAAQAAVERTAKPAEPIPEPLAPLRIRGRSEFADGAQVVRELRLAAGEMKSDPDRALARFDRAFATAADWWCRYPTAEVKAAADAVVECIYQAAGRPEHLDRLVAMIAEPAGALAPGQREVSADEVWPAAWSAGVLARANRERDLPPQTSAVLGRAMLEALGRARPPGELTLENGVDAALRVLPQAVLAAPAARGEEGPEQAARAKSALERWVEGVTLVCGADEDRRERHLAEALGWVLTSGPGPETDPRGFEAITLLASQIKWRAGGPARGRLMDWFRDSRVSDQDLRVLTAAIATRSSAEGVDSTMVLSMSARADDRLQLRASYARAWGLAEASARAEAARGWVEKARAAVDVTPRDDELDHIEAAAQLAELAREAVAIWRGESTPAPAAHVMTGAPSTDTGDIGRYTGDAMDGAWAERYLEAERNIPVRLERLAELEMLGRPIGWTDASVLAEAACFSSPMQVRAAAQKVVEVFADEPTMVSALLDMLPITPRTRQVSDMYSRVALAQLPRATDPEWELLTRRALGERLLAMLADEGVHGKIEQAAVRIASAYLSAVGESVGTGTRDAAAEGARRGAEMLADATRREAEGVPISSATRFSIEQIDRRRAQRRAQAIGPVQGFGAEQAGLAEMLAYLVATERPENESAAAEILEQMGQERRRARHVFTQIWATERAIVRLWLVRMGEPEVAS